jgi:hypothetical protein
MCLHILISVIKVALRELRLMRTLERIEKLKQEGRWSFCQPKKQKEPMIAKGHWDWLLDEMVRCSSSLAIRVLMFYLEMDANRFPRGEEMEDYTCVHYGTRCSRMASCRSG